MHFILRKQLSETNANTHAFSKNLKFDDFSWMLLRANENAVAGHTRPAGL